MSKKILLWAIVMVIVAGLVAGGVILAQRLKTTLPEKDKTEIASLVENFGKALVKVDKIAPEEEIAKSVKAYYTPFLTPDLLSEWTSHPEKALGRMGSSPWPDRIEILSIEKIDEYTVRVKGNVVWVASGGNGTLKVTEKVPISLVVKKVIDPIYILRSWFKFPSNPSRKWLIDNVWSNRFAFYDSEKLLRQIKTISPDINMGEKGLPYVLDVIHTSLGFDIAVVDMQSGSPYYEYYTLMKEVGNGYLDFVYFRENQGDKTHAFPEYFAKGKTAEHEEGFDFYSVDNGLNNIFYNFTIERNQSLVNYIRVDAYRWNKDKNWFELDEDLSRKIRDDFEYRLIRNIVSIDKLKFTEIKSDFSAVGKVALYNGTVAFSFGSGRLEPDLPSSATINRIGIFDVKTRKMSTIEVTKDWSVIDKIDINDKWILFRIVENIVGTKAECFAINRQTNEIETVVPKEFLGNYVSVSNIALLGDDAFASISVYEKKGTFENSVIFPSLGEKLVKVNLKTKNAETVFDGTGKEISIISLQVVKDSIAYLVGPLPSSKETDRAFYIYKSGTSVKINAYTLQSIDSFTGCKDDDIIIYGINSKDAYSHISDLNTYDYIFPDLSSEGIAIGSKDYFVTQETYTTANSSFPMPTELYSKLYVLNRATGKVRIIKLDYFAIDLSMYGDELCFVKQSGGKDSVIYLNLKDNGF
jgi:hypothetical protein